MPTIISAAEAKRRLSELIGRVAYGHERIIIERKGKPMAAVIGMADLTRLEALEDQMGSETHPIMRAFGGWADRQDLDELLEEIYAARERALGREVEL
ncbi:MAG TPA: type II toxin-antitoxin system prevent-host-death family antitoxin [Anaerolineae bacterium]|nr:type II toxin-antitoxin system prevent-host-death family antitoxin [Anaerolineae bacterium]